MNDSASKLGIDSHPQRAIIVRRIMDGLSLRQVIYGLVPPVSLKTIHRYKTNVIKPIVDRELGRGGVTIKKNGDLVPSVSLVEDTEIEKRVTREAIDGPVLSIFRQRLEELYGDLRATMVKANTAVRVATDKDGNEVVVGADLGIIAPLANQLHKNLEMLGRATGELEPQGGGSVSIQILCPTAGATVESLPRITFASADAIEAGPPQDTIDGEIEEIGLLQAP